MKNKINIGGEQPEYGVFLAPMAGFSDRAMRRICRDMGAEYSVTEMISAKAVTFGDKKTYSLARIKADEGPVGLQIFGSGQEGQQLPLYLLMSLAERRWLSRGR